MSEEILVNHRQHETRVAVVQQGVVQEILIERAVARGLVGNLYLGRVSRVLPGMQSAFVDIGLERAAFLHVADLWQTRHGNAPATQVPIEKLLFEGQSLLVQVIKDPLGTKGARLSTQVSIAGRLLVYLPHEPHIGVSQRIGDENERQELRQRVQQLIPEGEKGGFIVRTSAEDASPDELASDISYLRGRWQKILEVSRTRTAPALVYQELALTQRVLRDLAAESTQSVIVDSADAMSQMQEFAAAWMPSMSRKLRLHQAERPLFEQIGRAHV